MMNVSAATAIARKTPSLPTTWLSKKGMLLGRMLDFGCGKGKDARFYNMEKYDLNYHPHMPEGVFDTITCNYVLNVIPCPDERQAVVDTILSKLDECGTAFIAVRNDLDTDEFGFTTSKGTWQGNVEVPSPFGLIRKVAGYRLYSYSK